MKKLARCLTQGNYFAAIRLEAARLLAVQSRFVRSNLELLENQIGRAAKLSAPIRVFQLAQRGGRIPRWRAQGVYPYP